ncbi:hypothetical protein PROFUN_11658 [Planoprotostelium fungivorum]|uniref:Uncharacterized protein n=1 Tax=Planoprotostelium fungivorum TaxID=1890364 RepID=A0A2P6N9T9_9EUKA|nr:hypothetical protein PROFUN_11658 [Planoprotostelium fungivorum]
MSERGAKQSDRLSSRAKQLMNLSSRRISSSPRTMQEINDTTSHCWKVPELQHREDTYSTRYTVNLRPVRGVEDQSSLSVRDGRERREGYKEIARRSTEPLWNQLPVRGDRLDLLLTLSQLMLDLRKSIAQVQAPAGTKEVEKGLDTTQDASVRDKKERRKQLGEETNMDVVQTLETEINDDEVDLLKHGHDDRNIFADDETMGRLIITIEGPKKKAQPLTESPLRRVEFLLKEARDEPRLHFTDRNASVFCSRLACTFSLLFLFQQRLTSGHSSSGRCL